MSKSNELKIEKTHLLPASLDYSKLPHNIFDVVTTSQYEIDREAKLTWDGKQFILRVPKEVSLEMGIKEGQHIKFIIVKKFGENDKPDLKIRLIQNGKAKE